MDIFKEKVILDTNPGLYERYLSFPEEAYKNVHLYGLVLPEDLCPKIYELEFGSYESFMFQEIVELIYLERSKALPKPVKASLTELAEYLNLTNFQNERYTLAEFIDILFVSGESRPPSYTFGYASTDPTIVNFIQKISLKASPEDLYYVKRKSTIIIQNVIDALNGGASFGFMAEVLLNNHKSWVVGVPPSISADGKVGKLFLDLSYRHNESISPEMLSRLVGFRHMLAGLASITNRKIAMEKLLLMIYFPEYIQLIYGSPHPMAAFGAVLMKELSGWRYDVAEKFNWNGEAIRNISLLECKFRVAKDYYDGFRESSIFDSFIQMLKKMTPRTLSEEFFVAREVPIKALRGYKQNVIEKEYQGTVYSIVKDQYKLEWGSINPFSERINLDFENECMRLLLLDYSPVSLWPRWKYLNIIFGNAVPISRLVVDPWYPMHNLAFDHCKGTGEEEGNIRIRAAQGVYEALANYYQPQMPYQSKWNLDADRCFLSDLFDAIWSYNIEHCNLNKSFEVITADLENDHTDLLTRMLLLRALKHIVERHYSTTAASKMDFTAWTDSLKEQLHSIFNRLQRRISHSKK